MGNFKEDIARIRAFVFDVDGVMADGGITVTPEGEFLRTFYAKDGYALSLALKKGYRIAIITGGRGKALQVRFDMIGIEHVYTNCHHKLKALHELRGIWGMEPDEIMYMGDDVPDLEPMTHVGMPVCPADAAMEVIGISRYVSQFNGGAGCVRDVVEQVMRARGDWYKLGDEPIIVVVAGDQKIDNAKYKAQFHQKAKMLTFDEACAFTGHAPGGVCSFALPENVKTYLDVSLRRFETVFPAAGSSNSAIEMTCEELERYSSNFSGWVDVCKPKEG